MPMAPVDTAADMVFDIFSAAFGFVSLFVGVFSIISVIAMWIIMLKMGEPGWYAIIPFFNLFVIAKHSFGNGLAMFIPCIPVIGFTWFFAQLFRGFGLPTVPAILLAFFAFPIGLLVFAFNRTPWMGM